MRLKEALNEVEFTSNKDWQDIKDIDIKDIAYNSKDCKEDYIFVAIEGKTVDGHKYIQDAYELGARIFIISKEVSLPKDSIKILVKDSRKVLSKVSANFFKNPSTELVTIGITGTKGKTTTANIIRSILQNTGINTGVIGTNGIFYNNISKEAVNTTPESYELQRIFRDMIDNKVKIVVMEVSSGGLMMDRVNDIDFDIALFTNISPDHIGPKEHPNFQHYLMCKSKLFKMARHGIVNIDDDYGEYIIENSDSSIETFSIKRQSDFKAINIDRSRDLDSLGSKFLCKTKDGSYQFRLSLPGEFNIYNGLAAIAVCKYLKIDTKVIMKTLKSIRIPGRVEVLPILDYATVIVDYAHNGVSLQNVLDTLKEYNPNRLICLVGSVGGRTQGRRKELGDVAAKECDICILTADNPDYEDPRKIINEMAESFVDSDCEVIKESDRETAVRYGIGILEKDDIFIISGKGHEKYQLIKGKKEYYSDQEVASNAAKRLLEYNKPLFNIK